VTLVPPPVRPMPDLSALAPRARAPRPVNATLVDRFEVTSTLACFRIRPDSGPWPFVPGQYVPIGLAGDDTPPRPYSIASRPGARDLEFVISLVPGGALTSRLFELPPGARLHLGPARGLFRLDPTDARRHLLVATGSGIAPMLSMVSELARRVVRPPTVLVYGARSRAELAVAGALTIGAADWLTYCPTLSRPTTTDAWTGRVGRVTACLEGMCAAGEIDPTGMVAYLCGNPGMVGDCSRLLLAAGLDAGAVQSERFTTT
jgi:ferredoxin-NADP reductase